MDFLKYLVETSTPSNVDDIKMLEEAIGIAFPLEYKSFLMKSNGGILKKNILKGENFESRIEYFLGVGLGDSLDIEKVYYQMVDWNSMPRKCLAIAQDGGGNYILLSLEEGSLGEIYFWEMEEFFDNDGVFFSDFRNVTKVADNFPEFFEKMEYPL